MRATFTTLGRLVWGATALVLRLLLVLVVIEGTASWIGFGIALPDGALPPERERLHMRYDPELGWAHVPDTHLEDFYGAGRHLTINAQGFRGKRTYTEHRPQGRLRAICAGDQFTLGTGVGDDDTWCAHLETLEPRLETLNLGQGGYGLDQSYLWYRRDGTAFETDLVVFAFARHDFVRMERETYQYYPKPLLRLGDDGVLDVLNVPVPHAERVPWLVRNAQLFEQLRIVQLARPAIEAFGDAHASKLTVGELSELSGVVFEALQRLSDQQGATLVLLYLPTRADYDAPGDLWRRRIAREARRRGIVFIDLVDEQKSMTRREMMDLYVPVGTPEAPDAHPPPFNEAGNAWVAESLWSHLQRLPELAARLETQSSS